ncbi:DUF1799 domain-containing protein [Metapseudomonas otitidis]|nr:DUF1799 domain-containing protein [Pseudomonas otitidis]
MANLGLTRADLDEDAVEVFPDNWCAFTVFEALFTQWRTGACGATGLDYTAIPAVLDLLQLSADRRQLFSDIRVMEHEALMVMAESRNQDP